MQRIGVGVLVAAAAVVAWITLGPAGEDGDAADAPSVSSAADPFDPIRRTPALVLGRIDREADPLAGGSDDPVADAGSSPEDSAPDPRSTGGGEYGMTGGGGQGPSRTPAEGRRPIDTADPASPPTNPLAPPAELPADAPSDGSDPGTAPVDPAELTDVEAQVAKLAEEQGLVDPSEADTWAKAQVDPDSPPAEQGKQFEEARNSFIALDAATQDRVKAAFGTDLPPSEQKQKKDIGKQILSTQPTADYLALLEKVKESLKQTEASSGGSAGIGVSGSRDSSRQPMERPAGLPRDDSEGP